MSFLRMNAVIMETGWTLRSRMNAEISIRPSVRPYERWNLGECKRWDLENDKITSRAVLAEISETN